MGRTSKPLWIVVSDSLIRMDPFPELEAKGHRLTALSSATGDDCLEADIVFGPNCWRMLPELAKYTEAAIKAARAVAYPTKKGQSTEPS